MVISVGSSVQVKSATHEAARHTIAMGQRHQVSGEINFMVRLVVGKGSTKDVFSGVLMSIRVLCSPARLRIASAQSGCFQVLYVTAAMVVR